MPLEMILEIEGNVDIGGTGSLALQDHLRAVSSHARDCAEFGSETISGLQIHRSMPRELQRRQQLVLDPSAAVAAVAGIDVSLNPSLDE